MASIPAWLREENDELARNSHCLVPSAPGDSPVSSPAASKASSSRESPTLSPLRPARAVTVVEPEPRRAVAEDALALAVAPPPGSVDAALLAGRASSVEVGLSKEQWAKQIAPPSAPTKLEQGVPLWLVPELDGQAKLTPHAWPLGTPAEPPPAPKPRGAVFGSRPENANAGDDIIVMYQLETHLPVERVHKKKEAQQAEEELFRPAPARTAAAPPPPAPRPAPAPRLPAAQQKDTLSAIISRRVHTYTPAAQRAWEADISEKNCERGCSAPCCNKAAGTRRPELGFLTAS